MEQYNILKQREFNISYSFKTNPVVATLLEKMTDCDFSIHSFEQAGTIKDKGRVWFLPQGWSEEEAKSILGMGIRKLVIDNEGDLRVLEKVVNDKITLLLRIKMKEHTIFTGKYFVYGFSTRKANELLREFHKKPFIKGIGIHFHRKTENVGEWSIREELSQSITEWDKISIVNIGGGLPVKYANVSNFNINFILDKISELKGFLDSKGIKLILEPGRFIAAPAIKLHAEVVNVVDNNIFVNCSVYNSFPDTLYYSLKLPVEGEGEGDDYLIKGNTPCSMDIFRYRVKLPKRPQKGDKITFLNAGAYNFHSDFMWLKKIETRVVP